MLGEFSPLHRAPFGGEYYVFRDAIHNLIEIEDASDGKYVRELLRTPELQRLRRLRQNGLSSLVYPSIETTRFPHALGSFHIAQRMTNSLIERQPKSEEGFPECLSLTKRDCLAFCIAALLHDIGHGPLSHVWEECWAAPLGIHHFHEEMGTRIATDSTTGIGKLLAQSGSHQEFRDIGKDILRFLTGKHHLDYLLPLLGGNLDVDRLDFIARDTRSAGVTYGFHDLEWIIRSLRFARIPSQYIGGSHPRWIIAIDGRKGLSTLVQFLHARENMYRLVYLHKTTRAATRMLALLLKRAGLLAKTNMLSCRSPELRDALMVGLPDQITVSQFLKLDDTDIWSAVKSWADDGAGDSILRDLSQRLLSRDLFKVFLLSKDVYDRLRSIDEDHSLGTMVRARVNCAPEDAEYYYTFDAVEFDVIGSPPPPDKLWRDVWIMESGALGFEFKTLRTYWQKEVRAEDRASQYLLIVHPAVVQDLAGIVERLSFRSESAKRLKTLPHAPKPYRVVASLGAEGAWKEVYVGTNTSPGSAPEGIVALKRYKTVGVGSASVDRDVTAINVLSSPHPNLATPRLLKHEGGEFWIVEPLWTGSLENLVNKHGPRRDILEIIEIAEQLFSGLSQLHSHNLRHTDIKPENCGILATRSDGTKYVLGDFGCLSSLPDVMPSDGRLLGTLRTRAPEVLLKECISLKSDVWSMAATIYALCLMRYPFMPFSVPHDDTSDRARRESEIEVNMAALLEEHRKNVKTLLPPVLAHELEKCFESEGQRSSAKDASEAFQTIRSELAKRNDTLFETAWQRAEDIMQLFDEDKDSTLARFSDTQKTEIEDLIGRYKEFVPEELKMSLSRLVGRK